MRTRMADLPPSLTTSQNPDELCAAATRFVWFEAFRQNKVDTESCPEEYITTWDVFVLAWLHKVPQEAMAEVDRSLEKVLGQGARWDPWPPSGDPVDVRAIGASVVTVGVQESGSALLPFFDVMAVHKQWLSLPTPRPDHPLVAVVEALVQVSSEARVSHIGGITRIPYAGSEVLRRSWQEVNKVTAIEVDGDPLVALLQINVPNAFERWLYVDDPASIVDSSGNLLLNMQGSDGSNIYPQDARLMPLPMVALRMLGDRDSRDSLRSDLWMLLTVVYANVGAVTWTEKDGAQLLARTLDGGFRSPEAGDIKRWHRLTKCARSIEIWYAGDQGSDFVRVVFGYPLDDGRIRINKPSWYQARGGRFTLTGATHRQRYVGKNRRYSLVIGSMEYWVARSYAKGTTGAAPLLQPTKRGGHGPWVPAPSGGTYWEWDEVLLCLALEHFNKDDSTARSTRPSSVLAHCEGARGGRVHAPRRCWPWRHH